MEELGVKGLQYEIVVDDTSVGIIAIKTLGIST